MRAVARTRPRLPRAVPIRTRLSASQNEQGRNVPSPGGSASTRRCGRVAQNASVDDQTRARWHRRCRARADRRAAGSRLCGNQEQAGVEIRRAVATARTCCVAHRKPAIAYLGVDRIARLPSSARPGPSRPKRLRILDRPVERDPGHHLGMGEMAARSANFPDALIRPLPVRLQELKQGDAVSSTLPAPAPGQLHARGAAVSMTSP